MPKLIDNIGLDGFPHQKGREGVNPSPEGRGVLGRHAPKPPVAQRAGGIPQLGCFVVMI